MFCVNYASIEKCSEKKNVYQKLEKSVIPNIQKLPGFNSLLYHGLNDTVLYRVHTHKIIYYKSTMHMCFLYLYNKLYQGNLLKNKKNRGRLYIRLGEVSKPLWASVPSLEKGMIIVHIS